MEEKNGEISWNETYERENERFISFVQTRDGRKTVLALHEQLLPSLNTPNQPHTACPTGTSHSEQSGCQSISTRKENKKNDSTQY
jgi:hypothetical protein